MACLNIVKKHNNRPHNIGPKGPCHIYIHIYILRGTFGNCNHMLFSGWGEGGAGEGGGCPSQPIQDEPWNSKGPGGGQQDGAETTQRSHTPADPEGSADKNMETAACA